MTLKRQTPGECEWKLSVFRDGEECNLMMLLSN